MSNYQQFKAHNKRRRNRMLLVQACLGVLIVALLFGISYAVVKMLHGQPVFPTGAQGVDAPAASVPVESTPPMAESLPPASGGEDAPTALQAWNTDVPVERVFSADITASDARMLALPANGRLSDDYFRDALFIGDSITQGFATYGEYKSWMRVCAYKSTSPYQVVQNYVGQRADKTSIEMWDDINVQQGVRNIYIMFGANAIAGGQTDEAFLKSYGELLDMLRTRFPGVPIYVQSILPTTAETAAKKPQFAQDHIRLLNNALAKMARDKGLYYVDLWEALADGSGYLRADLAGSDGIHLLDGSKYRPWLDYLAAHTVYNAVNAQFVLEGPYM